ncbi:MAG: 3-hydroxybutyryl-CoA dehydrogenase [Ferruginibacter sp.]|nr:3-hydroxybutyryl-CoA dehydrogenase [Ferruginibacter sp.]
MIQNICVAGAGTMGSGIAMAAAQNGFGVRLFDTNDNVLNIAKSSINKNLDFLLEKNKITAEEKLLLLDNIIFSSRVQDCKADLIIEAIIEKEEAKVSLFHVLSSINNKDCIFASNTSSLSITSLQKKINHPERVAGMHFFNPAQIMKLVEVVKGEQTAGEVVQTLMDTCRKLNKTPVLCVDSPGFIVNRVARHYYLEAMHLVESKAATIESVDALMEASGFKMGPFKLMDLIGMDINLAVSQSLYDAFEQAPRFKPSALQIQKVKEGALGKKTGRGFYQY